MPHLVQGPVVLLMGIRKTHLEIAQPDVLDRLLFPKKNRRSTVSPKAGSSLNIDIVVLVQHNNNPQLRRPQK